MSVSTPTLNRPLIFISALTLKLLGGFAVGASALANELPRLLGITNVAAVWPLGAVCLGLAFGLAISGPFYLRYQARTTCFFGAALWGAGVLFGARSLAARQYELFLLAYGLGGVGMGLNYQSIVSLMARYFPTTPLATSTIGPFGSAIGISLFFLQAVALDFSRSSLDSITRMLTIAGVGVITLSYIGSRGIPIVASNSENAHNTLPPPKTSQRAWRLRLGALVFANTLPGMTMLGIVVPLMSRLGVGSTIAQTELIVATSTLALFLGGSSVPLLVPNLGYNSTFTLLFLIRAVLLFRLALWPTPFAAILTFATVLYGHGAGFGMIPAIVKRQDHLSRFPNNSGLILSGWGIAGFAGAGLNAWSYALGRPEMSLLVLGAVMGVSGLVLLLSQPRLLS